LSGFQIQAEDDGTVVGRDPVMKRDGWAVILPAVVAAVELGL
jgi:hypothetical protein